MPKQQWQPVEKYSQQEIIRHKVIETTIEGRMITLQDSMGYELSMLLRPDYAVCQLVNVDTPQPMEMPDGPGWWAYEDERDKFVAHLQIFTCADGGVDFKFDNSGRAITSSERFGAMYPGKWYKIILPWEVQGE